MDDKIKEEKTEKVKRYRVTGKKMYHNCKWYYYGDVLPDTFIVNQTWIDQKFVEELLNFKGVKK